MDKLTFDRGRHRHHSDVIDIVAALNSLGHEITYSDAAEAWEAYSDSMAAGWMNVPSDADGIYWRIRGYLNEVT